MRQEPTTAEKMRKLSWSIGGNSANAFFVQLTFFGSVFILFLDYIGLNKSAIGFLLSLIPFSNTIALFIAPLTARFGYKRTFISFFLARKAAAAFLLLVPWVLTTWGMQVTFYYVIAVVMSFALFRSIGETAHHPWIQEFVPKSVQGKYTAVSNISTALVGFIAVSVAGYVLGQSYGINGFIGLFAIGIFSGVVSGLLFIFVPGGAPVQNEPNQNVGQINLLDTLADRDFLRYLTGIALITFATVPLTSFLPLYMREEVGLTADNIVWLQLGTLFSTMLAGYPWGWASDRYGSKPVMLSGLWLLFILPFLWWLMPRHSPLSLYIALGIAFLHGVANLGWGIGAVRLLFVSIIPPQKKMSYTAIYFAWIGLASGISQLMAGRILDYTQNIQGSYLFFPLDAYTPLFFLWISLSLATIFLLIYIRADSDTSVRQFMGLFFRGNPFIAVASLMRFYSARDESSVVRMTERLGQTRSTLTVEELLEALQDPRFNVRFEAIIAISRMRTDPRLSQALVESLEGSELSLSVISAWAMGRIGDPNTIDALRRGFQSPYRSIQAHTARALGAVGDQDSIPELLNLLQQEEDKGLLMAYASSLGRMQATEATEPLLALLEKMENKGARMELALALARIIGNEHHFIQLLRQARGDMGTATAQSLAGVQRKMARSLKEQPDITAQFMRCIDHLASNELDAGLLVLSTLIDLLPLDQFNKVGILIMRTCASQLKNLGQERIEYSILLLHVLAVGQQMGKR